MGQSRKFCGIAFAFLCIVALPVSSLCQTNGFRFVIDPDPFQIRITDNHADTGALNVTDARVLGIGPLQSSAGSAGLLIDEEWYPVVQISEWDIDGDVRRSTGVTSGGHNVSLEWETGTISDKLSIISEVESQAVGYGFSMDPTDNLVGMGQRFTGLQLRGQEIPTNDQEWTVPIPFFINSSGYGLFLETSKAFTFDFGTKNPGYYYFQVQGRNLSMHLIGGPEPRDIVRKYTALTGYMMHPPEWQFGLWKWRDWVWNEFELYEDASMLNSLDIPATVMLIDSPWSAEYFDFEFNKDQFPHPENVVSNLDRLGFRTILWVAPFMNESAENFKLASDADYLVKDSANVPLKLRWWNPSGSVDLGLASDPEGYMIDFTNPDAKAWWQEQIAGLIDLGVAGFKVDGGELLPDNALLFDGRRGYEVKDYPALYLKALYDVLKEKRGDDFVLLPRAGWAGSQKWSPAFWAADQSSDFNDQTGLPSVIRGGQGMGLVGFPFWGSDIGGYQWSPSKKVFIRWTQFGAFSPVMQTGGKSIHEPWLYDDETVDIFRKYVQLYTHMKPYLMHFARQATDKGDPVMRAMFYEFPSSKEAWEHEMQYMYGSHLLIAPIYTEDDYRDVYLPDGYWMDFWDHQIIQGGRVYEQVDAPLWKIPVYVKADHDALHLLYIPMLKEQLTAFQDRVRYYLRGDAKFMRVPHQLLTREAFESYLSHQPDDIKSLLKQEDYTSFQNALHTFQSFLIEESTTGQVPVHIARTLIERINEIDRTVTGFRTLYGFVE